jgi:hypothetical protein
MKDGSHMTPDHVERGADASVVEKFKLLTNRLSQSVNQRFFDFSAAPII